MLRTKEFYEIMEMFENNAKSLVSIGSQGLRKEDKDLWKNQSYYCDGNANNAFKMFLHGVSFGKSCYQQPNEEATTRNQMLPIILDLVIKIQARHIPCVLHVYNTEFDVTVRDLMGEVIADYCLDDESGQLFDECVEVLTKIAK